MRLKIFGIPKISLIFLGLVPAILWCAFHASSLSLREHVLEYAVVIGLTISVIFTGFLSRGFFGVRFGILFFSGIVMGEAFCSAMMDRDFWKLGLALLLFGLSIPLYFWFESRVNGADLNPRLRWFEGEPKLLPQLKARIQISGAWLEGSVRTIDRNGFFVFLDDPKLSLPRKGIPFELTFRDSEVAGTAKLSAQFFGQHAGFGLQFLPKDLYHFSQYTALVERLKGEGL
jgi:hypothetical protein